MAERVGFYALNAELLHGLVQKAEIKDLLEFRFSLDFIERLRRLIPTENVAQQAEM